MEKEEQEVEEKVIKRTADGKQKDKREKKKKKKVQRSNKSGEG
jgi:hypothetical protein